MINKALFTSDSAEWETPWDLYNKLDMEFGFTLDVCATSENAKFHILYTKQDDALKLGWCGVCWMNPPYGEPEKPCKPKCKKKKCVKRGYHISEYVPGVIDWVKKARDESLKGATVVCLLPVRSDTKWFHSYIWDEENDRPRPGVKVRPLKGRLKFGGAKNSAPFPSMIVIFRKE